LKSPQRDADSGLTDEEQQAIVIVVIVRDAPDVTHDELYGMVLIQLGINDTSSYLRIEMLEMEPLRIVLTAKFGCIDQQACFSMLLQNNGGRRVSR